MEVAVVVPTYNRASLLPFTLESILAQSHPASEVVVVDDGSTDDTAAVVARFGAAVRCVALENSGAAVARRAGVERCRSPWIALCDSDDLWTPDHLAAHARLRDEEGPIALSFSNFRIVRDSAWESATKFDDAPPGWWEGAARKPWGHRFDEPIYAKLLRFQCVFQSAMVFSRELYDRVGGPDPRFSRTPSEDLEMTLRLAEHAPSAALDAPTSGIRKHGGNFSADFARTLEGEIEILRHAREHHRLGRAHAREIDEEIERRSAAAADAAFASADLERFRRMARALPAARRTAKLRLKMLVAALPDPVARPVAAALARARGAAGS
jgi:hypothetical protein